MATILYAWELGGGLGHVTTGLALADAYRERGHHVAFVVKDIGTASRVMPQDGYRLMQAPVWWGEPEAAYAKSVSYAEILLTRGYGDSVKLTHMVRAWMDLLREAKPDLLMLDFAPTAMFAAHLLGVPCCSVGAGFFMPPRTVPVAPYDPEADGTRVELSEARILTAINQARARLGANPLECFADFFVTELDMLCTWPELEHYPERQGALYFGPVLLGGRGLPAPWRANAAGKIFAYLFGNFPQLETILRAIRDSGADAHVHVRGAPPDLIERMRSERVTISSELYALDEALCGADLLICHGNFSTVWQSMLAGTPILCLPAHAEQHVASQRLAALGLAILPARSLSLRTLTSAIHALLNQRNFRLAAEGVARKYAGFDRGVQLGHVVESSLAVLKRQNR